LDSAGQGLYREKKVHKYKCKNKNATLRQKILKNTLILVHNQNFEKQKKWNSKIPEPHPLLLESMKYVKKSGHGEECSKCFTRSCDFSGLQLKNTLCHLFLNSLLVKNFCRNKNIWTFSALSHGFCKGFEAVRISDYSFFAFLYQFPC
jgi:hypothetical protein